MKNILLQNRVMDETKRLKYRLYIIDMESNKLIDYSGLVFVHLSNCESIIKNYGPKNKNNKRKES